MVSYVWWMIPTFWWSVGPGARLFELLPSMWWWIRVHNLLRSTKNLRRNCGWWSTTWLLAHLPLSHPLATWNGPLVILGSHYNLVFRVKPEDPPTPLLLNCAVTNATNYDILGGQPTLYPLSFGLDNWTKEGWIRPGWSAMDGRRELIHVAFVAGATIAPLSMIFGCVTSINTLPYGSGLLEESWHLWGVLRINGRWHFKVHWYAIPRILFFLGTIPQNYSGNVRALSSLSVLRHRSYRIAPWALVHPILWRPPGEGITSVQLFGGIGIRLVAMLEVGLTVRRYVYVNNSQVSTCMVCHRFYQLMVLYP